MQSLIRLIDVIWVHVVPLFKNIGSMFWSIINNLDSKIVSIAGLPFLMGGFVGYTVQE